MPPADLAAPRRDPDSAALRRSRLLARCLLLGACALGLAGLAAPGSSPAPETRLSASAAMATGIQVEPRAPHTVPAAGRGSAVVAQRASRSRTLPLAKKRTRPVERWVAPNGGGVVSPYGMRWGRLHKGLDFGAGYGAPIAAVGDGVVIGSGYLGGESGYGLITIIRHDNGYWTAYAHQSRSFVDAGEHVTAGELIGLVGSTGHSTGPHLHFEVRTEPHGGQINPRPWLRKHGVYV